MAQQAKQDFEKLQQEVSACVMLDVDNEVKKDMCEKHFEEYYKKHFISDEESQKKEQCEERSRV